MSPIICGTHVTLEAGTGLVHTAPAHGVDDYVIGKKYGLPVNNPVGDDGRFLGNTPALSVGELAGKTVWEANPLVLQELEASGRLLKTERIQHSYPHCWRHKTPIIFRATHAVVHRHGTQQGRRRADPALDRRARRRRNAVLPGLGPRPAGSDDEDPPGLVRLAPAQLGRADPVLPAQGNRRSRIRARRTDRAGRPARREGRHRSLVQARCRRTARRRGRPVRQDEATRSTSGSIPAPRTGSVLRGSHAAELDLPGRPLSRRLRPASRLVPVLAAHRLRHRRPRAVQGAADARLRGRRQGPQDVQVQGQRHRAAAGFRHDGRRHPAPVDGVHRLLRRADDFRRNPQARRRRLSPHPQHAALPAGQHCPISTRARTCCRSSNGWKSTATRWR